MPFYVNSCEWISLDEVCVQAIPIADPSGYTVTGVIGSKPPHILSPEARKKPVDIKDMFIDVGATSKEEVME